MGGWFGWHVDLSKAINVAFDVDAMAPTTGEFVSLLPEGAVSVRLGKSDYRTEIGFGLGAYVLPLDEWWASMTYGVRGLWEVPIGAGSFHVAIRIAVAVYDYGEPRAIPLVVLRMGWRM